ncbi:hypothetical protein HGM15179_006510 [Zosterops borbonicus]|uniref:Uncharacterized protein n=1 Tax=Zosterops borbonicus TaxID=364589 RepID=A0A8K1LP35_9PASS|nr:hypothetical protein HGM15179_006510 [Zosterops borbonicus]
MLLVEVLHRGLILHMLCSTQEGAIIVDSSLMDDIIAILWTGLILCNTDHSKILADDRRNKRALIEAHVVLRGADCETKGFVYKNGVECE